MSGFDLALAAVHDGHWLIEADGRRTALPVDRWHGPAEPALHSVIDRCSGPTVDVGCGPGRLTAALADRGVLSLGVDTSPVAVGLTRRRGGAALRRTVFDPLPGEGRWWHVILADGNIGIGGDPAVLLRRCADLLRPGGTVLVELEHPGAGLWHGFARVDHGPSFRWARLGVDALPALVREGGLVIRAVFQRDRRWFAELEYKSTSIQSARASLASRPWDPSEPRSGLSPA